VTPDHTGETPAAPARDRAAPVRRVYGSWIARRWLLTRALTICLLVPQAFDAMGNVEHYFLGMRPLFAGQGYHDVLREYPAQSLPVFVLPRLLSGAHLHAYMTFFVLLMLALDAIFVGYLWRAAGRRPATGLTLWLWLLPALGPLSLCRLDLVPAILAGGALLAIARRPAWAGTLAAIGAAVKLWPAALVPSLWLRTPLAERSARWRMVAVFALVAVASCGLAVAVVGADRLVSPLTWQSDRSLQVESYAALPLLVAGMFSAGTWHVDFTRYLAFEISGPGVGALLSVASVASLLAVALLAVLWLRAARLGVVPADAIGWLVTATVALVVLTDKTLSPQYLLWIGAVLAALGVHGTDPAIARATRLMLVSAALTQLVYPTLYPRLVGIEPVAVLAIVVRDAVLVALTALAVRRFWALTAARAEPDVSAGAAVAAR
jgi:Glycosyltransferase family 87